MGSDCVDFYRKYLELDPEEFKTKAFVYGVSKKDKHSTSCTFASNADEALDECRKKHRGHSCIVYAEDNFVSPNILKDRQKSHIASVWVEEWQKTPEYQAGKRKYEEERAARVAKLERDLAEKKERENLIMGALAGASSAYADAKSGRNTRSGSNSGSINNNPHSHVEESKQYARDHSYCLQEVKDTNGFTATVRNTCSQDLEVTYCWGLGSYCRTHRKAGSIPAGREKSVAKSDEASERGYFLISFAAPAGTNAQYKSYINGVERFFAGKECSGSGCLGY